MYEDGETLVLSTLRGITASFGTANTSQSDWKILNNGASRQYAILKPGAFRREPGRMTLNHWTTIIEVWYRYQSSDAATKSGLYALVGSILAYFDARRHLGNENVVNDCNIARGSEPQEMWKKGGGPIW